MEERDNLERLAQAEQASSVGKVEEKFQADPFDFPEFTEFVDLPSQGKYYDNIPESVEIKYMTFKHEDILSNSSYIKKGVMLDKFVAALLVDKSISVDDLLSADKTAIVYHARATAYGDEFEYSAMCSSCGHSENDTISISENLVSDPGGGSEFDDARIVDGKIVMVLPKTEVEVTMKLMDGEIERNIAIMKKANEKHKMGMSDRMIQMSCIVEKFEKKGHVKENQADIKEVLGKLPGEDAKFMRETYVELSPSAILRKAHGCSKCGFLTLQEVGANADFFWPKRKNGGNDSDGSENEDDQL